MSEQTKAVKVKTKNELREMLRDQLEFGDRNIDEIMKDPLNYDVISDGEIFALRMGKRSMFAGFSWKEYIFFLKIIRIGMISL